MIRFASALPALALAAGTSAGAQQAARDFQLPPAPTPTQDSRVQGPVDEDAPIPVRPRVIGTTRPATPTPAPTATAAPSIVLPAATPSRAPAPARGQAGTATATRTVPTEPPPAVSTPLPPVDQSNDAAAARAALPPPTISAAPPLSTAAITASEEGGLPWLWIALGILALAAAGAFIVRWRRAEPATPTILRPLAVTPAAPAQTAEALAISVEAVRMDRSVMNATVGYRVTLRNRTAKALTGLAIEADLVSASNDRPTEAQIASPSHALTPRHTAERLAPGQSLRFEGQVRLPLAEAGAIWQGRVGLLVPLLRLRATAAGVQPIATTLVIGRREGAAARPQPFRLDEPPRSYAPLAQRTLDAVPLRA